MVKVRGSLMIETLIATVLISIITLLFSFLLLNTVKEQTKKKYEVKAQITGNYILDSLRSIPVNQIAMSTWENEQVKYELDKVQKKSNLSLLSLKAYFNNRQIYYTEILKYHAE